MAASRPLSISTETRSLVSGSDGGQREEVLQAYNGVVDCVVQWVTKMGTFTRREFDMELIEFAHDNQDLFYQEGITVVWRKR